MKKSAVILVAVVVALLATFAFVAWSAVRTKGVTYDETLHAPSAYLQLRHGDFRMNPEHPPLWKYWSALGWLAGPVPDLRLDTPAFVRATENDAIPWLWARAVMYGDAVDEAKRPPSEAPAERLLWRSRAMMLALAVGAIALSAAWAFRIAGPIAAVVVAALFAFEPNWLAHAPLVCNDVAIAGALLAVAIATWRVGRRLTVARIGVLGLCCGAAVMTKFTGLIAGPMVAALLIGRAMSSSAWMFGRRSLSTRATRTLAAVAMLVAVAAIVWASVWATYGFRFALAPGPDSPHIDLSALARDATIERAKANEHRVLTPAEADARGIDLPSRAVLSVAEHRLLPEALCAGVLRAYALSTYRASFRWGDATAGGTWWYFPFAVLVKTPLALLAALALAVWCGARRSTPRPGEARATLDGWTRACLAIPAILCATAAIASELNIGLRHLFPVYPFVFIGVGVVAARATRRARIVATMLAVAFATESLAAFPNFVPYFNVAAGGARGGAALLGDSNLDWGQDLPALARWQHAHPDRTLTLHYFGTDSPDYRGIRARPMPDDGRLPTQGVLAVSVGTLQLRPASSQVARRDADLLATPPTEVLGGSIYLYDLGGK